MKLCREVHFLFSRGEQVMPDTFECVQVHQMTGCANAIAGCYMWIPCHHGVASS